MYIYTVTVTSVKIYTFLHPLIWVFLEENYVNFDTFCIIHNFTPADADALSIHSLRKSIMPMLKFAMSLRLLGKLKFFFFFLNKIEILL